jgi:hypothetical protein
VSYDDWKATDCAPEPEREGWCDVCEHHECDCPCCTEPVFWRCESCGDEFNSETFSHSRAEHAGDCDGACRNCPVEIQCGPVSAVPPGGQK